MKLAALPTLLGLLLVRASASASDAPRELLPKPGLFKSLTEPPCSYCSTEQRKNFVRPDDRVVAWIRGPHNGGGGPPPPLPPLPPAGQHTPRPQISRGGAPPP